MPIAYVKSFFGGDIKLTNTSKKTFYVLWVAFVVLRILPWLFGANTTLEPDSLDYIELAKNIWHSGAYMTNGQANIFRQPAYPLLLSLFIQLPSTLFSFAVVLSQIILDCITACALIRLGRKLFPDCSPIPILVIHGLNLLSILYVNQTLSETLFTCILMLSISRLATPTKATNISHAVMLGMLSALLIYIKTAAVPLLFIFILWLFVEKRIKQVVVMLTITLTMLSPWIARYHRHTQSPGISSTSTYLLYRYFACALEAQQRNIPLYEMRQQYDQRLNDINTENQRLSYMKEYAVNTLLSAPLSYTWIHLKGTAMNFSPVSGIYLQQFGVKIGSDNTQAIIVDQGIIAGIKHYLHGQYWSLIFIIPMTMLLILKYAMALIGFHAAIKTGTRFHFLLFAIGVTLLALTGPDSHPRFRVPVEPLFALYAAYGMTALIDRRRSAKNKSD